MPLAVRLALADLRHARLATLCQVVGFASLLLPLLILFGIRNGVIADRTAALLDDPESLRITIGRTDSYPASLLAELRADPDIRFAGPHPVQLAVLADMALPVDGSPVVPRVTLLATGAGDPYLPEGPPPEPGEIVLSAPLAGALGVEGARARVEALLDAPPGEAEGAAMSFAVTGRTEAGVWGRMGALLHPDDLFAIQDWTHGGIASGDLDAVRGTRAEREAYPSLRIYAADADGAFRVMDRLAARGVPTGGTPGTAAELVSLRDALDTGFVTVAAVALAGVAATLSATLWMAVIRNRRPLSLLRLGGLPRRGAMLIPVTQALAIGAMGWAISILAYAAMTGLLDRLLADTLGVEGRLARLRWPELAASGGATLAVCALAAVWAATAVTAITPEEGFGDAT